MNAFLQAAITVLVQSTGLLVLGLLVLSLTRRHSPAVQTLVGRATLAGVGILLLLAPLSGRVATVWRIPTPTQASAPGATAPDPETGRAGVENAEAGAAVPANTKAVPGRPLFTLARGSASALAAPNPPPNPSFRKDPVTEERGNKEVGLWNTVVVLYAFPSVLLLVWLGVCRCHLTRLRRTAQNITPGSAVTLLSALTPNPPLLLTHPAVHSPFLAGLRRPALFLPVTYDTDFDQAALRAIFVHELAHRDRRDNAWTLTVRLLTAVLWPQPLLWLLCRRMEQISEDACDEAVLASDCPPRTYADCLLTLAERHALGHRQRTLSAGITPVRSSLGRRVQHILSKGTRSMSTVSPHLRLTIAALALAAALGGAFLVSSTPAQSPVPASPAPAAPEMRYQMEYKQDLANLKAIGSAIIQYTQDHDEFYPDSAHWMDEISPYLKDKTVFYDPFFPGAHRYGYAFNDNCSKQSLAAFDYPAETVAVFDSTLGTRNASDTGQSLALRPVPRTGEDLPVSWSGYGFADGHVKWNPSSVHYTFSLNIVGTWFCPQNDATGNVMIFSRSGTIETVGPWPGDSREIGHSYGRYTTEGRSKLKYTLTRVWVEGQTPWATDPEKHDLVYTLSGDTLTLSLKGKYMNVYHRIPAYTDAMLGIKSNSVSRDVPDGRMYQAQFLAGLTPVQGPGVIVTLTDSKRPSLAKMPAGLPPPNSIHDSDINQVVNELKAAGAEAISINGQRLVATSSVRSAGPVIYINDVAETGPYLIKAIGNAAAMTSMLQEPRGIAAMIKRYDPDMYRVQEAATLTLPAYAGGGAEPRYARPVSSQGETPAERR